MQYYAYIGIYWIILLFLCDSAFSDEITHYQGFTRNVYYQTSDVLAQGERFSFSECVVLKSIKLKYWTSLSEGTFYLRILGNEGGNNVPLQETNYIDPIEISIESAGINEIKLELDNPLYIKANQIFVIIENNLQPIYLVSDSEEREPSCVSDFDGEYYNQVIKSDHKGWTVGNLAFDIKLNYDVEDIKEDPIFTPVDVSYLYNKHAKQSISFSDLNRDDFLDLVYNGRIYLNNKYFGFECIDSTISKRGKVQANIILDVNNDGLDDVLFLGLKDSSSNKSMIYFQNHGLDFERIELNLPQFENIADFKVCDIDENGFLDLIVTQSFVEGKDEVEALPNYLLKNTTNNQFEVINLSGNKNNKLSYACKILDYNEDGKEDIYIINYASNDEIWLSNEALDSENELEYLEIEKNKIQKQYIDYSLVDIDYDGSQEKVYPLIELSNYHHQILIENAEGEIDYLSKIGKSINYSSIASGDIDNDGQIEILCSTPCECNFSKFFKLDKKFNSNVDYLSGINQKHLGENSAFIDLNNDGQLDLISFENNSIVMYKNNRDNNNYLDLVTKKASYNNQTKYVYAVHSEGNIFYSYPSNQEGLLIQRPNILHFGIGENTIIDSLVIYDNNGNINRVISDLSVNNRYNLEDLEVLDNNNEEGLQISLSPNPFTDKVNISFNVPLWTEVKIRITDLNGTIIWNQRVLCQNEGRNNVVWQAHDKNFQRVPNGTYFVNIEQGNQTELIKVIKIDN